jgi:hypothetical protein
MRTAHHLIALGGLLVTVGALSAGCIDYVAEYYTPLTDPKLASGGSGGGTSSSTTGTGGTGGMSPDCSGDPSEANVIDACGVFVQANAAGATEDGTQAHPYKTLQKALDNAGVKRVYACSSAPYSESVTIAAPVEMFGGFECAKGWAWKADGRSALSGPAGAVALTLTKQGDGAKVQGFAITAASATVKGGSSIAVAVEDVAAALINCEVTAGDGMAGEDGVTPAGVALKGADAALPDAATMNACINAASLVGGAAGMTTCEDGVTAGGMGGKGGITATMSGDGQKGVDGAPTDAAGGKGGAGEDAINLTCAKGTDGKSGTAGAAGAAGLSPGVLSVTGLSDTDATDGKSGTRGYGGGGGGGAKAGLFCTGGVDGNGASGGGGGAGGCGGKGGGGGKAGGSSLAIVSLGTKLTLTDVTLKTGKGGAGGKGALQQFGGVSGLGAVGGSGGAKPGCTGGAGGLGGGGGSGGGGRGGHSVGIAYASAPTKAPTLKGFAGDTMGVGGAAGPSNPTGKGAAGAASACWDFSKNAGCTQ